MKTYDIKDAEVTGMSLVKAEDEPDYKTFRRKTYRGVGAPQGSIYIVIKMKKKDRKFEAAKLIEGHKGVEVEKVIAQYLRARLQEKYGI